MKLRAERPQYYDHSDGLGNKLGKRLETFDIIVDMHEDDQSSSSEQKPVAHNFSCRHFGIKRVEHQRGDHKGQKDSYAPQPWHRHFVYSPALDSRTIQPPQLTTDSNDAKRANKREKKSKDATTHDKKELRKEFSRNDT